MPPAGRLGGDRAMPEHVPRVVVASSADRVEVPIPYDYLILATGVRHSYFGHEEFEQFAPGLKSLADAVAIRNRILQAFEQAEAEEDPRRHRDLLTFVLVGAGPTGVELAAALAVMVRTTLRSEFRRIDPLSANRLGRHGEPRAGLICGGPLECGRREARAARCGGPVGSRRRSDR